MWKLELAYIIQIPFWFLREKYFIKIITCALLCTSHNFKTVNFCFWSIGTRQQRTIIPERTIIQRRWALQLPQLPWVSRPQSKQGKPIWNLEGSSSNWRNRAESQEAKAAPSYRAENWCGTNCTKGDFSNLQMVPPRVYSAECVHVRKLLQAEESPRHIWEDSTQSSQRAWDIACSHQPDWKTS